jgi:hypothetical protein
MFMDLIYDDASEALHGTLYGCTFHMGFYDPGTKLKKGEDIARYSQENLSLLVLATLGLLEEMLKYIYTTCELKELENHCLEAQKEFSELNRIAKLNVK